MLTTLANLRRGDVFEFKNEKYKAGDLLINKNNENDCVVSCKNVVTGEKKFFELETIVEVDQCEYLKGANWFT